MLLRFADVPSTKTVTTGELSLLLEGASFTVHKRAKPWRPATRPDQSPVDA